VAALLQHHAGCDAFSFPRFPLTPPSNNSRGTGYNGGGGGKTPGTGPHYFHDGDGNGSGDNTSLYWMGTPSDELDSDIAVEEDGEQLSSGSKREETNESLVSEPTNILRGGGGVSATESNDNSKKYIGASVNDKLDSLQTMLFEPFRMAGSALSKKLPANPFQKKEEGQSEQSKLKQQQELLSSTKIRSVSAPNSELLPPDVITQCAKESNLIGGTLAPETLELTANMINRMYLERGYVMNSVTGATLVPPSDGKEGNGKEGHVELKVREVKLAGPRERNSSPVHIRFVEKINDEDTGDGDESVFSLPSQSSSSSDQSQSDSKTYRTVPGRTRPSKIARMVKLAPGSHFQILPQLWSQLAAFPGSGAFGGGGGSKGLGKSAIFSTIHAVRPVPTLQGDTVELEIIATENKPYLSLEYGVTKSLYSDQWEGELDLRHANVFGGGEVATVNVRKGRDSGRKEDPALKNWKPGVVGGPVNWRMSIKDDYLAGSDAGYDLEVFRDHVGVSGNRGSRQRFAEAPKEESSEGIESPEKERADEEDCPLRTGASMRLRLPQTRYSAFLPRSISTRLERVDPFAKDELAQCTASMSTDIGPYHHNCNVSSRPLRSTLSAIASAGGRWDAGKAEEGDDDATTLPYATGTLRSQQIMPLSSESRSIPSVDLAMRHAVSASSRHLPRHEAILLGLPSRIRGYRYNYQQSPMIHQPQKIEKEGQNSVFQSFKQLVKGDDGEQFRPPIAISKSISGTMEFRIPFERVVRESIVGSGTFVLFGDWCVAQAQLPSSSLISMEETASLEKPYRHSSAGIGLRKVVQGIPLKMDACITEHGTKGLFFGIGA